MRSELDVSVVVCAYAEERWGLLQAALDSLRQQTVAPREVIVIVDHNLSLLAKARLELVGVHVAENRAARGLSGARNTGLSQAAGTIVAFLDDDAIAVPDWLERLLAGYGDPKVMGVGGKIEPLWVTRRPAWFPPEFDWVVGCSYVGLPKVAADVRNLIGCNMSYRREVFATIGNFHLGYGCDETELCIRLRRQWPDKRLLYEPRARVIHYIADNRTTWRHFRSRCYFEGGSKAVVTWLQGQRLGLASERTYVLKTLTKGIWEGVADTLRDRQPAGIARAVIIVLGLVITGTGFLLGGLRVQELARRRGWSGRLRTDVIR